MRWIKQYVEDEIFIDVPEDECVFDDVSDGIDMCELDLLLENSDLLINLGINKNNYHGLIKSTYDVATVLFLSRMGFLE